MAEQQTKPDILVYGLPKPVVISGLSDAFILHKFENHRDLSRLSAAAAGKIRGVAVTELLPVDATMLSRLPKVEIIAAFGVGYDHVDVVAARQHNVVVTHTPDVLTEETADAAIGLLI